MADRCIPAVLARRFAAVSAVALAASTAPGIAAEDRKETPAETIAAHIRAQGYPCASTLGAERDAERSEPHEAVWVLKCENATYRVRLVPDMAARVERLE
jgi:hypothetical protein